ncbi:MAG: hypothetical protein WBK08_17300 [Nitrospira sp.]|nr:MAG: hypothetical protein E8D42_11705 [Nitrospira sp.]
MRLLQQYFTKPYALLVWIVVYSLVMEEAVLATLLLPRDPCSLISVSDINHKLGASFRDDPKGDAGKSKKLLDSTLCSWIAPPVRKLDTGIQRNVMMIVVTFWSENSISKAKEWLHVVAEPIHDEKVMLIEGLGDETYESSALFVRKENIVFSVRFQPYTRAPRDETFIEVEGRVAELILSRLK